MEAQRRRVLVVEDQDLVGDTIASVLEDEYEVLRSSDADHALQLLESEKLHLVLLDCLLPGGGYPRVLERCDAIDTPVVLMSGDLERVEELGHGRRAFLAKPFAIDVLLETIQRVARS